MEDLFKPLEGTRIIALEHFVAGPFGSMLLADFGADVIRVERPVGGDPMRVPQVTSPDGTVVPIVYLINNRNKRSLTLDLKTDEGKDILRKLLATADVLYENLGPAALTRMGLGWDELQEINPRLIYLSVSGFGRPDLDPGPYTDRPALDFIAQGMSGMMGAPTFGEKPMWLGISLPDLATGQMAALGLMAALNERQRSGKGQRLDVSMYDVAAMMNDKNLTFRDIAGRDAASSAEVTNQLGIIEAKDGHVAVGVINNAVWDAAARMIGRDDLADDPDYAVLKRRAAAYNEVIRPAVQDWSRTCTREEVTQAFLQLGVPVGPVQTSAEVLACPHLKQRDMTQRLDTEYGPIATMANPVRFAGRRLPMKAPPTLGEDTDDILRELGYDQDAIAQLQDKKVV